MNFHYNHGCKIMLLKIINTNYLLLNLREKIFEETAEIMKKNIYKS